MKRYLKSKTYFSQLTASRGGLGTAGRHRDGVKRRPGEFMLCSQRTTDHGQLTKILCLLSLGCLLPPVSCKLKLPYVLCAMLYALSAIRPKTVCSRVADTSSSSKTTA